MAEVDNAVDPECLEGTVCVDGSKEGKGSETRDDSQKNKRHRRPLMPSSCSLTGLCTQFCGDVKIGLERFDCRVVEYRHRRPLLSNVFHQSLLVHCTFTVNAFEMDLDREVGLATRNTLHAKAANRHRRSGIEHCPPEVEEPSTRHSRSQRGNNPSAYLISRASLNATYNISLECRLPEKINWLAERDQQVGLQCPEGDGSIATSRSYTDAKTFKYYVIVYLYVKNPVADDVISYPLAVQCSTDLTFSVYQPLRKSNFLTSSEDDVLNDSQTAFLPSSTTKLKFRGTLKATNLKSLRITDHPSIPTQDLVFPRPLDTKRISHPAVQQSSTRERRRTNALRRIGRRLRSWWIDKGTG